MTILFADTETAGGWPTTKRPLADPSQPHLVQLAWMAFEEGRCVEAASRIVRPDGWEISPETTAIHGITTEQALRQGSPLDDVLARFADRLATADLLIAHNALGFDVPILEIAAARCLAGAGSRILPRLAQMRHEDAIRCTMVANRGAVTLKRHSGGNGNVSLADTHAHYFGAEHDNQHDALGDVMACARVHLEMERRRAGAEAVHG